MVKIVLIKSKIASLSYCNNYIGLCFIRSLWLVIFVLYFNRDDCLSKSPNNCHHMFSQLCMLFTEQHSLSICIQSLFIIQEQNIVIQHEKIGVSNKKSNKVYRTCYSLHIRQYTYVQ